MLSVYRLVVFYIVAALIGLFCGQVISETPLHLARKLSNYKRSSDFLKDYAHRTSLVPDPSTDCQPSPKIVELPTHSDPNSIYVPNCVTAMRCGGCCFYSGHSCLPITVVNETHTVEEYKLVGDTFELVGQVELQVEAHTQCECECRVTESDCNDVIHNYEACQCICVTEDKSCSNAKVWNESTCKCQCPQIIYCLEDEYFNYGTCECQKLNIGSLPIYSNANTSLTASLNDLSAAGDDDACSQSLQCPAGQRAVLDQPRCVCAASHVPRRSQSASGDVNENSHAVP